MIDDSGLLLDELAGGEDGEVGDAAHGEACGQLLVFVGVDLEDDGLAGHVLCRAGDLGAAA